MFVEDITLSVSTLIWSLAGVLSMALIGVVVWIWNRFISKLDILARDFEVHKVDVSKTYVTREHFNEKMTHVFDFLKEINNKLDKILVGYVTKETFEESEKECEKQRLELERHKQDKPGVLRG